MKYHGYFGVETNCLAKLNPILVSIILVQIKKEDVTKLQSFVASLEFE